MKRLRVLSSLASLLGVLSIGTPEWLDAQTSAPSLPTTAPRTLPTLADLPTDPRALAQAAQAAFERVRREQLPRFRGRTPRARSCPEPVGLNRCYFYDSALVMPAEPAQTTEARRSLLLTLDSLGEAHPGDNWISGQRVRYHLEAGAPPRALAVARGCRTVGWWCDALEGLALHQLGRYVEAEASFERVLARLSARERCTWRDLTPYLDDDARRVYARSPCGTPDREAFEARVWWLARTRYTSPGNDSRTEHFARRTYLLVLRDAATPSGRPLDEADEELLLRFGWPRTWATEGFLPTPPGMGAPRDPTMRLSVIGGEPVPAYRFIPAGHVIANPTASEPEEWMRSLPPVIARYHPPYAARLLPLRHQRALFRRGDSALVVIAYDASRIPALEGQPLVGGASLTSGALPALPTVAAGTVPARGTLTARAPWGPLLLSVEVGAEATATLARARLGIRPPFSIGTRPSLSDLLLFAPSEGRGPRTVDEALALALPAPEHRSDRPLGLFWEVYNTDPAGVPMTVTVLVTPEAPEASGGMGRALRFGRAPRELRVSRADRSEVGARVTAQQIDLDLSALAPGAYLIQLTVDAGGGLVARADRALRLVAP